MSYYTIDQAIEIISDWNEKNINKILTCFMQYGCENAGYTANMIFEMTFDAIIKTNDRFDRNWKKSKEPIKTFISIGGSIIDSLLPPDPYKNIKIFVKEKKGKNKKIKHNEYKFICQKLIDGTIDKSNIKIRTSKDIQENEFISFCKKRILSKNRTTYKFESIEANNKIGSSLQPDEEIEYNEQLLLMDKWSHILLKPFQQNKKATCFLECILKYDLDIFKQQYLSKYNQKGYIHDNKHHVKLIQETCKLRDKDYKNIKQQILDTFITERTLTYRNWCDIYA